MKYDPKEHEKVLKSLAEFRRERDVLNSKIYAYRRWLYKLEARRKKHEATQPLVVEENYPGRKINGQWLFPGDVGYDPNAPINPEAPK